MSETWLASTSWARHTWRWRWPLIRLCVVRGTLGIRRGPKWSLPVGPQLANCPWCSLMVSRRGTSGTQVVWGWSVATGLVYRTQRCSWWREEGKIISVCSLSRSRSLELRLESMPFEAIASAFLAAAPSLTFRRSVAGLPLPSQPPSSFLPRHLPVRALMKRNPKRLKYSAPRFFKVGPSPPPFNSPSSTSIRLWFRFCCEHTWNLTLSFGSWSTNPKEIGSNGVRGDGPLGVRDLEAGARHRAYQGRGRRCDSYWYRVCRHSSSFHFFSTILRPITFALFWTWRLEIQIAVSLLIVPYWWFGRWSCEK